jgi:hypothetical protein
VAERLAVFCIRNFSLQTGKFALWTDFWHVYILGLGYFVWPWSPHKHRISPHRHRTFCDVTPGIVVNAHRVTSMADTDIDTVRKQKKAEYDKQYRLKRKLLLQQLASKDIYRVHDRVLSSLKMEGIRFIFFVIFLRPSTQVPVEYLPHAFQLIINCSYNFCVHNLSYQQYGYINHKYKRIIVIDHRRPPMFRILVALSFITVLARRPAGITTLVNNKQNMALSRQLSS